MSQETDIASLTRILAAIDRALGFIAAATYEMFSGDARTKWAVYSQMIVLGAAADRVSRQFRERNPDVPWSKMIGMCNRLLHDYDRVDWLQVWDTLITDVRKLRAAIEPLIPVEPD